ncbi:hypothetical protein [Microlunatus ginsengisoli]
MATFAMIGSGWRRRMFLDVARAIGTVQCAGELHNDEVVRLAAPRSLIGSPLVRRQIGHDLDVNGFDTEHISLAIEQSAITGTTVRTGPESWTQTA